MVLNMDKINFTVNGQQYTLSGSEVNPRTTLNDYLRCYLNLPGTKAMCHEGGCGACVVSVSQTHPRTNEKHVFSVNSCLVHILSCHNWNITTIEGVGNRKDGYHSIQSRLASFNGTQCGYCTPGWIMSMYSLYTSSNQKLTIKQVENSFGSNMCRCTGYRPILDAFKSFATDATEDLTNKIRDLEDLDMVKCTKECERRCSIVDEDWCIIDDKSGPLIQVNSGGSRWYKASTIKDVFKVLAKEGVDSYRFVAGNTGQGVYPVTSEPRVLIDISSISTIKNFLIDDNLVVGAGMTLTDVMALFLKWPESDANFTYLQELHDHLDLVAHIPVRNIGTIGGNLALKNKHPEFPSDVFLILETVGACITIVNKSLQESTMTLVEFLKTDLRDKLITDVKLPPLSSKTLIRTYKIMSRAQNVHAIVNAGFLFKIDSTNKVAMSNIVYEHIDATFIHATETEKVVKGSELFTDSTLQKALKKLSEELNPKDDPPEPSPLCRKTLALGLFYKAILSLAPNVDARYKSGGYKLQRGVSHGTQTFDTDKSLWPLNQPIPKLEALTQCSGEVKYVCDVNYPQSVHIAFVISNVCIAEIEDFDASEALKMPGVIAFLTAKDIPGKNTFSPLNVPWQQDEEEILASKHVYFYGQPVAIIAATSHKLAVMASDLVKVSYKKSNAKPVLSIQDALVAPDKDKRVRKDATVTPTERGDEVKHVIKGTYSVPSQYHYTMETQSCSVIPTDTGVTVNSATQWMDLTHVAVADMLAIEQNKVEIVVPRVGGAYGGKATRAAQVACACALAAYKLNRPASLVMPLTHNMAAIGKRQQYDVQYEVGVNHEGVIQYLEMSYYSECGCSYNDSSGSAIGDLIGNLYDNSRWKIAGYSVLTDKASNTWCRAPGTAEAFATLEHLMERIAFVTKQDSIDVRIANLQTKHNGIKDMIDTLKYESKFDERTAEIKKFNEENAWRKRALKLSIMSYPIEYSWNYPVTVSVYHGDGSIAISHGGIEMGQGINTKVAQVCAYTLKVPLEKVSIYRSNSFTSPNSMASNGSITSDCVAHATVKACTELLTRFESVKSELNEPTWEDVVKKAYEKGINLQASYMTSPLDFPQGYDVYGVCASEVELDVLTGTYLLNRVDLMEDIGVSLSPDVDIGQIEGAFIMGLGMWTSEQLVYDQSTGKLLTDRTWTYHPPGAKDIPVDFRIMFRANSPNKAGVLRSKATGEPALTLAVSIPNALHDAIFEARKEFGYNDTEWVHVDTPFSVENILKAISPKIESFKL